MITGLKNLVRDDAGATLVEYAVLLALVALMAITALHKFELKIHREFLLAARGLRLR